mmetsp:Transcript_26279/g.42080  ORF Transcript_26279/g.42080 Transcript_26279/m.42080 type:complete len:414 (+) Transcript_26279:1834-3075(+)
MSNPEIHLRPVIGEPVGIPSRPKEATLHGPVDDLAVADLCVLGIFAKEPIQPMEGSFVWQEQGKESLILAICWRGILGERGICGCSVVDHAALEAQIHQRLRPKVHLDRHVLEGYHWKQRLSLEGFRDGLRPGDALAVLEKGDGIEIWTALLEIDQYSCRAATLEPVFSVLETRDLSSPPVEEEVAFGVEGDAILGVPQEKSRAGGPEAYSKQVSRQWRPDLRSFGVFLTSVLSYPALEPVATAGEADIGPGTRQEVLQASLVQGHEQASHGGWHHVQSCVRDQKNCWLSQPGTAVLWRILLALWHKVPRLLFAEVSALRRKALVVSVKSSNGPVTCHPLTWRWWPWGRQEARRRWRWRQRARAATATGATTAKVPAIAKATAAAGVAAATKVAAASITAEVAATAAPRATAA